MAAFRDSDGEHGERRPRAARRAWEWVERPGLGRWLFGPRSFGGDRVQVYGCSPGCLLVMLAVSVLLTLLLNVVLNWVF